MVARRRLPGQSNEPTDPGDDPSSALPQSTGNRAEITGSTQSSPVVISNTTANVGSDTTTPNAQYNPALDSAPVARVSIPSVYKYDEKKQKSIDNVVGFELAQLALGEYDINAAKKLGVFTVVDIFTDFYLKEKIANSFGIEVVYNPKNIQESLSCITTDYFILTPLYLLGTKMIKVEESLFNASIKVLSGSGFDQIYKIALAISM